VRLERRTLNGSMRFSVAGAGSSDNLSRASDAQGEERMDGGADGALHVDNRGQAGLTWTFDPRDIEGYALEDYSVIAVVQLGRNGQVEPAMSGFVNGSMEVDWAQVMNAAPRDVPPPRACSAVRAATCRAGQAARAGGRAAGSPGRRSRTASA
jgi:hypothetical protein